MKKLTQTQFTAIQSLAENPFIYSTTIEFFNNGLSRISIVSTVDANWEDVNVVLRFALEKQLPNLEYMGSPAKFYNPFEKTEEEIYFINFEGESLIRLIMRMAPSVKEKWTLEDIMRQEG